MPGSPIYVLKNAEEESRLKSIVEAEITSAVINTDANGIILRCDAIGSLEAITDLLKRDKIPIQSADIGHITKRDVIGAAAVREKDRFLGVILAFNVKILEDAEKESAARGIKIFNEKIIYNLVEK